MSVLLCYTYDTKWDENAEFAGLSNLEMIKKRKISRKLRIMIVLVICVFLILGASCLYTLGFGKGIPLVCPIKELTGLYCPGCGAGRACYSILHGNLYYAFRMNPLLVLLLPFLGLYYCIVTVQWVIYGEDRISKKISWKVVAFVFAIVIIYGIIRNINLYPFTLLRPTWV